MTLDPQDEQFLHRALGLARAAVGLASPNPTVACVLTRDSQVIGEGAHHYDSFDHAEIVALKQAASLGQDVKGVTAYVTLEPCSHQGRTGPCADALMSAGIARCVIATVDPNPTVRGNGIAILQAGGIDVVVADTGSQAAHDARRLNDAFAHWIQHHRPFVTLKAAVSLDGKLAPSPLTRTAARPHWITGEAARADVQRLRHASDAILTGFGTVLADNPALTDRTGLLRRRPLLRIVLDSQLRTPSDAALLTPGSTNGVQPDVLLVCNESADAEREAMLRAHGADILRLPGSTSSLELHALLAALAERNITSLLVEAGSAVNGSFLRDELVDKVVLYFADSELGLDALPFAEGIVSPYVLQQQLASINRASFPHGNLEDIRITGYLHDPWASVL